MFTPAPIVDNIQLTERVCERPTNLTSTVNQNNEIVLTWTGAAGSNYDVMYRNIANTMSGSWTVLNNQSSPCTLTGLNKGRYQVWVRHRCDSLGGTPVDECDASHWARLTNIVVITSDGCINFTDIHNSNLVRATYGNYTNPTMNVGVVDFGEYDVNSRHTVN